MKNNYLLFVLFFLGAGCLQASDKQAVQEERPVQDFIRLDNGDSLHGTFLSWQKEGSILFQTPATQELVRLDPQQVNRLIFGNTRFIQSPHLLFLSNGNSLPCTVQSLDNKEIIVDSPHLGCIKIPRVFLRSITFEPSYLQKEHIPQTSWKTFPQTPQSQQESTDFWHVTEDTMLNGKKSQFLLRENSLLPKTCLRFHLEWKNTFALRLFFHPDFPTLKKEYLEGQISQLMPTGYALHLTPYSAMLMHFYRNDQGVIVQKRMTNQTASLRLRNTSEADFDIRFNQEEKVIYLYVNGNFSAKWHLSEPLTKQTKHFAFMSMTSSKQARFRISHFSMRPWNGRQDSAASFIHPTRDTLLFSNGLDRLSGRLLSIKKNTLFFQSKYTESLQIPIQSLKQLSFATESIAPPPEKQDGVAYLLSRNVGKLTAKILYSEGDTLFVFSPLLGPCSFHKDYLQSIDFTQKILPMDLWENTF